MHDSSPPKLLLPVQGECWIPRHPTIRGAPMLCWLHQGPGYQRGSEAGRQGIPWSVVHKDNFHFVMIRHEYDDIFLWRVFNMVWDFIRQLSHRVMSSTRWALLSTGLKLKEAIEWIYVSTLLRFCTFWRKRDSQTADGEQWQLCQSKWLSTELSIRLEPAGHLIVW